MKWGKLRELGELEELGVLEEVEELGEPAEGGNRQCQGWSWGLCPLGHWAECWQSAARMVEELQGDVGNGPGEESHCTVHGC